MPLRVQRCYQILSSLSPRSHHPLRTAPNHEGLAPGSEGYWDEHLANVSPWAFDLADISVPVLHSWLSAFL